jgi:hypothetical protein|tara:strand:- start:1402 stop:1770 length:369 start_codon:yes stop_codon:yes gene_type:complete
MQLKDQSNSNSSTRKNIRFENELLAKIDAARGSKPFGTWVQEVCSQAVHTPVSAIKKDVRTASGSKVNVNSYAALNGLPSNITKELHEKIMTLSNEGLASRKIAEIVAVSKATVQRTINASK